ncbi:PREDICTED: cytochrome P450 2J6-like [Priapulus caudatus]|uniref:Cytochrome P450 2J6-like n=1 Tax=Priapulus caudatus TaxID=37621 RepID=A0ABM1DXL4_PRICU|nr:PREDICTED: cytochrome P450 2J6-like [Priapulus caudatus]
MDLLASLSGLLNTNTLALLASLLVIIVIRYLVVRPRNLPPGPCGIPIFGYLLSLFRTGYPWDIIFKKREKYGDIWSMYLGSQLVVVLHNWKLVKEALVDQGDHTSYRAIMHGLNVATDGGRGIVHSNGRQWKEHRRFLLKSLRGFGVGTKSIEERIMEEVDYLTTQMAKQQGKPFSISNYLHLVSTNIILHVVFGKRFDLDNKELNVLLRALHGMFHDLEGFVNPLIYVPWLRHLPFIRTKYTEMVNHMTTVVNWSKKQIAEHRSTYDPKCMRDVVDDYIREQKEQFKLLGEESTFTESQFAKTLTDLIVAGIETFSTTFDWFAFYMAMCPDVQSKVRAEIDEVIGTSRLPTYEDRLKMPYTEATCMELQRIGNIAMSLFLRTVTKDIELEGYNIPAGSALIVNLYTMQIDEGYWKNPDELNPDRFIDGSGKVIVKPDSFMPFSLGRRNCIGESLGKMELFLFLTSILQKFELTFPKGAPLPTTEHICRGITMAPKPYEICATQR